MTRRTTTGRRPVPYAPATHSAGAGCRGHRRRHPCRRCCSKDAIADVTEAIRRGRLYRPAHETVFDAILDLTGRGEPVDMVRSPRAQRGVSCSASAGRRTSRCRRTCRSRPTPATTPRSSARRRSCGAWSTPVPDRADRLRRRGPGRRHRRRGQVRGLQDHRQAGPPRTTRRFRHHGRRPRRDRGDLNRRPASTASPPASPTSTT